MLVWVVVCVLIRLRKGVVIHLPCTVIPETTEVSLGFCCLFYFDRDNFDLKMLELRVRLYLVVSEPDFNLEEVRHDELISLNRVKVVFLLLLTIHMVHLHLTVSSHHLHILLLLPISKSSEMRS